MLLWFITWKYFLRILIDLGQEFPHTAGEQTLCAYNPVVDVQPGILSEGYLSNIIREHPIWFRLCCADERLYDTGLETNGGQTFQAGCWTDLSRDRPSIIMFNQTVN